MRTTLILVVLAFGCAAGNPRTTTDGATAGAGGLDANAVDSSDGNAGGGSGGSPGIAVDAAPDTTDGATAETNDGGDTSHQLLCGNLSCDSRTLDCCRHLLTKPVITSCDTPDHATACANSFGTQCDPSCQVDYGFSCVDHGSCTEEVVVSCNSVQDCPQGELCAITYSTPEVIDCRTTSDLISQGSLGLTAPFQLCATDAECLQGAWCPQGGCKCVPQTQSQPLPSFLSYLASCSWTSP